ncbi:transcriptional regulator [Saccharomonospora marina XMU15]|uniref:Transcriptional regulator n=1 Tax=Saccharomonospora marina XMU15 TaxID=882083 RepID=H5X975_9PSEU|nr:transcriptional regulator [Saccharomonospora marina XMU15]
MDASDSMRINRALNKTSKLYRAAKARKLAELGLHPGQDVLLWLLAQQPEGMTVSELAARVGIEPPTATRSLARLESGGWFRREPVATDRRQVRIVVTAAGHKLIPSIERAWSELAEQAMGGVSAQQRDITIAVLEQANERLRGLVDESVLAEE